MIDIARDSRLLYCNSNRQMFWLKKVISIYKENALIHIEYDTVVLEKECLPPFTTSVYFLYQLPINQYMVIWLHMENVNLKLF